MSERTPDVQGIEAGLFSVAAPERERTEIPGFSKGAWKLLLKKAKERGVDIKIAAQISKESQKIINEFKGVAEIRDIKNIKE